jgi:hypothetical protein
MFAYCLNNPVCRKEITGAYSADLFNPEDVDHTDDNKEFDGGEAPSVNSSSPAAPADQNNAPNAPTALQPYYPPNNGFAGEAQEVTLQPGTMVQRTGNLGGKYIAPAGTPGPKLSLPYGQQGQPTTFLQVQKPIVVLAGPVAPWFGQIGGGVQYQLSLPLIHYINADAMRIIR